MRERYDVIIIGAGIAGMTAAIYAVRAGKKVLILESRAEGGQILTSNKIENWPGEPGISGAELARKVKEQAKALGAEFKVATAEEIEKAGADWRVVAEENIGNAGNNSCDGDEAEKNERKANGGCRKASDFLLCDVRRGAI